MNFKVRCDICFDSFPLEMFRFLPTCGHGLCIKCSASAATNAKCAICRKPKGSQIPVQIYLTPADTSPVGKAHSVVDNLTRISVDSVPISVEKAGRKIRRVMKDLDPEDGVVRELLDAARNLDERIYPLFLQLEFANEHIATLTAEIEELQRQLKVAEAKEDDMKQLRRSIAEARTEQRAALSLAEKNKNVALKEREDNSRLNRTIHRHLSDISSKEEEIALLRAKLTRRENRVSLLEKKLKLVSRTVKQPQPNADPDESLQIDNSIKGIRIPRKSNDWLEPARVVRKPSSRGGAFLKRVQTLPDIEL
ncbi:hypothetical protein C8R43DRAFT_1130386 [Mycena crocata]|nr:hypothetical protein C8R43DRAFT_1130386 [Mycena crocata]